MPYGALPTLESLHVQANIKAVLRLKRFQMKDILLARFNVSALITDRQLLRGTVPDTVSL